MNTTVDDDTALAMPFPEKRAWLAVATSAVVYGGFLTSLASLGGAGEFETLVDVFVHFTIALVAHGVIMGVGVQMLARGAPGEARAPLDERDRAIAHRATTVAFVFLMAEVLLLALARAAIQPGWHMTVAMLLAMAAADAVRNLALIVHYHLRRHG